MFWGRATSRAERKVGGYIGHYGLSDWWLETFDDEQRAFIESRWQPFGGGAASLTKGTPGTSGKSVAWFLYHLAGWFRRSDQVPIALAMLAKARETIDDGSASDQHFFYSTYIEVRYKQRNEDPQALEDVIAACEAMIRIAPKVIQEFRSEYEAGVELSRRLLGEEPSSEYKTTIVPPSHKGYQQLIVIRKKQGDKAEAARLQAEFDRIWRE